METHSSISPGKFNGQRTLVGYSPWGRTELDTAEHASMVTVYMYLFTSRSIYLPIFRMYKSKFQAPYRIFEDPCLSFLH